MPDYLILANDHLFTEDDFTDCTIHHRLNQTWQLKAKFLWLDKTVRETYLAQGTPIYCTVDDTLRFAGVITDSDYDKQSDIITILAESPAALLRNKQTGLQLLTIDGGKYYDERSDTLQEVVIPDDWDSDLIYGMYLNYQFFYTSVLAHLVNLTNIEIADWKAWVTTYEHDFTANTDSGISGITPSITGDYTGYRAIIRIGTDYVGATIASCASTTITFDDDVLAGLSGAGEILVLGPWSWNTYEHLGSESSVATLEEGEDIDQITAGEDLEKVYTVAVIPGLNNDVINLVSSIAYDTTNIVNLQSCESYLTLELSSTDTTSLTLRDSTSYSPVSGEGIVQIGDEQIKYTTRSGNQLQTLTRGYNGTTPTTHEPGDEVLLIHKIGCTDNSALGFPDSGNIRIGMETITYTSKTSTSFLGLTRGVNNTPAYAHRIGTWIRDGTFSEDFPQPNSPVDLYDLREIREESRGMWDRDGLDKKAQATLQRTAELKTRGTVTYFDTDITTVTIGDQFTILEDDATEHDVRCVGILRDQLGLITLEFGESADYIIEDINQVGLALDLATMKQWTPQIGTILSISTSGATAEIQLEETGEVITARIL